MSVCVSMVVCPICPIFVIDWQSVYGVPCPMTSGDALFFDITNLWELNILQTVFDDIKL